MKQPRLSREDRQIQLIFQALVEQIVDSRGVEEEIVSIATYKRLQMRVTVNSNAIEIIAFDLESKEIYAMAQYNCHNRELGYNVNYPVVQRSIHDLILLQKLTGITLSENVGN